MPRRAFKNDLEVVNPAPIWRRSLTESGMRPEATTSDWIVVAVFLVLVITLTVELVLK